jgi:hypothetical protein
MKKLKSINAIRRVLFMSGIFDIFGGFFFILFVGTDRIITNPPTHPFYTILIASFLFCLAYLQIMSAFNIRRYLLNIGVVILSRVFFGILFFSFLLMVNDFPITFLPTVIADLIWASLYIMLTILSDELRLKDLFLPQRRTI